MPQVGCTTSVVASSGRGWVIKNSKVEAGNKTPSHEPLLFLLLCACVPDGNIFWLMSITHNETLPKSESFADWSFDVAPV